MRRKDIKQQIREYFFINPTAKLRVRELERTLNLPLPSIIRYCKELKKEGVLTTQKIGNITFYTADKTNRNYLLEKKLYNIKSLHTTGLIDLLRVELSNPPVILFGSYAKGEDIEESDIDLYIETLSKEEINLKSFEKRLKRKIQLFKYRNIKEIKNVFLANNIINGIVLNGFVDVFE